MTRFTTRIRIRTLAAPPALAAIGFTLLLGAAFPSGAAAKNQSFPSGNSAINQYLESIPTAGGGTPSGGIKSHPGQGSGGGSVPAPTHQAMSNSGAAGQQAAAFANATAPASAANGTGAGSGSSGSGSGSGGSGAGHARAGSTRGAVSPGVRGLRGSSVPASRSSSTNPVKSVLAAFTGGSSGGLGGGLLALLIVILLGGCAIGLRGRYRR